MKGVALLQQSSLRIAPFGRPGRIAKRIQSCQSSSYSTSTYFGQRIVQGTTIDCLLLCHKSCMASVTFLARTSCLRRSMYRRVCWCMSQSCSPAESEVPGKAFCRCSAEILWLSLACYSVFSPPRLSESLQAILVQIIKAAIFGVGAPEALLVGVVALVVFGPKGLAQVQHLHFR